MTTGASPREYEVSRRLGGLLERSPSVTALHGSDAAFRPSERLRRPGRSGKLRPMSTSASLAERLLEDLKTAMKAKDEVAKQTLRMVKSELGKKELELGRDLDEKEQMDVLLAAVKSRRDSIVEYEKAGRQDLADAEKAEIAVVERYLPAQMGEDDARAAIEGLAKELGLTEKKQMGQLMKGVMERYRGQIDGKLASKLASSILS